MNGRGYLHLTLVLLLSYVVEPHCCVDADAYCLVTCALLRGSTTPCACDDLYEDADDTEGHSKRTPDSDGSYKSLFRWGKRSSEWNSPDSGISNNADPEVANSFLQQDYQDPQLGAYTVDPYEKLSPLTWRELDPEGLRYEKRIPQNERSGLFRWGKRSSADKEVYPILRWGKRSSKPSIFRWGKRAEGSSGLFRWGKRSSYDKEDEESLRPVFRWGKRSLDEAEGLRPVFRWGKRSPIAWWSKSSPITQLSKRSPTTSEAGGSVEDGAFRPVFRWGK